ncbi:MAG: phycobiliprotein lyase [Aphanocapsa lilacina HA4352-LM1]|nr:phycobiliprotein lyase [Aphanocapsa lilacina HA4352-LM1]
MQILTQSSESLISRLFQRSEGHWRSERRYYTLPEGRTQEMESLIEIAYLPAGSAELVELAELHSLPPEMQLVCGAKIHWRSSAKLTGREQSEGITLFGALGDILYRDRGFATSQPITALYRFTDLNTLHLRTEYNGSVFEEELKLVGERYRTRQTIISRLGEQQMIGQYLEKRI